MAASVWHQRAAQRAMFVVIGIGSVLGSAWAVPPTLNSSGLSPAQCYRRDSDCTQMCGEVTGDLRYECFSICDRMLDRCLDTGEWSDSFHVDPGSGKLPDRKGQLSSFLMRMLMVLSDQDGDGTVSPKEIESLKHRVLERADARDGARTPGKQAP